MPGRETASCPDTASPAERCSVSGPLPSNSSGPRRAMKDAPPHTSYALPSYTTYTPHCPLLCKAGKTALGYLGWSAFLSTTKLCCGGRWARNWLHALCLPPRQPCLGTGPKKKKMPWTAGKFMEPSPDFSRNLLQVVQVSFFNHGGHAWRRGNSMDIRAIPQLP